MRRCIEWKTKRSDGTYYEVRVSFFGGKYGFQFKEDSQEGWDYSREPSAEDLEELWNAVQRRYQRRQVTDKELKEARRICGK